jgi:hypothetical protein
MILRWRNPMWTAAALCMALVAPSTNFAQDEDDAPKKKTTPKKEKADGPMIRPPKKTDEAPAPQPPAEVVTRTSDPTTIDEYWRTVDYELNFGKMDEARRLLALMLRRDDFTPDAAIALRDRYGSGLLIRVASAPELGDLGKQFLAVANEASATFLRDAARIKRYLANLEKSDSERVFAIGELRKSGEVTAQYFAEAIAANPTKTVYADALAQMPPRMWEAVAAFFDSDQGALHSAAATALSAYRVRAASEALYHPLASKKFSEDVQSKAQLALSQFGRLVTPPDALGELVAVARGYYLCTGGRDLSDAHEVWSWTDGKLTSTTLPADDAAYQFGLNAAKKAYDLDAANPSAQTTLTTLILSKPNVRAIPAEYQALNESTVLGRVVEQAEIDRRPTTAKNAVALLSTKGDPAAFAALTSALNYPNADVQFEAAQAVLRAKPPGRFRNYDRIVPILIRALRSGEAKAVVVGDGDLSRGSRTSNLLRGMGFVPRNRGSGREAFKAAAEFGDVELIILEPTLHDPSLNDTLAELRRDARTAGIPVIVFEIDPPDFSPPVIMRPVTAAEREYRLHRQDDQVLLEEARTEMYRVATTQPERETRRFKSLDERVDYLLKRLGYVTDPEEYKKLMAEIPDAIPVVRPKMLDPLEIRMIKDWYAKRAENLDQLRDKHANVIVMPRVGKPEAFARALALFAPSVDADLKSKEARPNRQAAALEWLKKIAAGEFPYLDVRPSAKTLAELAVSPGNAAVAAEALGLIPSPFAQIRLAEVALAGTQPVAVRAAALKGLAQSVTRVGRLFPNATTDQLLLIGYEAPDGPLAEALDSLAKALGANAQAKVAKYRGAAALKPKPAPTTAAPAPAPAAKPAPAKKKADDGDL